MKVLSELDLRAVLNSKWMHINDFSFEYEGRLFTIPKGSITDLSSIPKVARIFISGTGLDRWGGAIHDYLYSIGHDRAEADLIFKRCLLLFGVSKFKAYSMYYAVRLGGSGRWHELRK